MVEQASGTTDDLYALAVRRRASSNGIFTSAQDVTPATFPNNLDANRLAVGADGTAVIGYQNVGSDIFDREELLGGSFRVGFEQGRSFSKTNFHHQRFIVSTFAFSGRPFARPSLQFRGWCEHVESRASK